MYKCNCCNNLVQFECLMSELDKVEPKSCPQCTSINMQPIFFPPTVNIFQTVGSLADKNTSTMSADEQHHIISKNNEYRDNSGPSWESTNDGMKYIGDQK